MSQKLNYTCAKCGAVVNRVGDKFARDCDHVDAGVAVKMSATVEGRSKVAG